MRRWNIGNLFGLFIFAAVATPSQDPISMLALAGALVVLFFGSLVVCFLQDRRKARRRAEEGWDDWSDDETSPLDETTEPVEPAKPVTPRYDDATCATFANGRAGIRCDPQHIAVPLGAGRQW
jgi:sec-independent protein translocase protein TatC